MPRPVIVLVVLLGVAGAGGYLFYTVGGATPGAGVTSSATSTVQGTGTLESTSTATGETKTNEEAEQKNVQQPVPAGSLPQSSATSVPAQPMVAAQQKASIPAKASVPRVTTVSEHFELSVAELAEVEVCDGKGRCLARTFFPFCTQDTPEARLMLQEACMDECATAEDEREVREELCEGPNYVREELLDVTYLKGSDHQLFFRYLPGVDGPYHVRVAAYEPGPLWVETYTLAGDTRMLLSHFDFEARVGSVLTYDIATGADGAIELRRAQVDYEGDGVADEELSHMQSAP